MTEVQNTEAAQTEAVEAPNAFQPVIDAVIAKVTGQTQELHNISKAYKARNGSADAVSKWLDASTDPEVVKDREQIARAMEKIKGMRAALEAKAKAALVPDDFDPEAVAKEFKEKRTATRTLIMQSKGTLASLGQDVSGLDELLDNLPNIGGGISASGKSPEEMEAIRKWASENGHDVKERGRIAKDVIEAYEASQNS